ncbi:MAG TPA: S24 family peptidase [Phaeodactylibacter sp.]|nr:S24 family peptidase [Phaeodactylibacter sp.]
MANKHIVTQRFLICLHQLLERKVVRSARRFAIELDYVPQSLSGIMNGKRQVTVELIRKAVEKYRFNPLFIFTGQGDCFLSDSKETESLRILTIVKSVEEEERIIHVPSEAQMFYATAREDPDFMERLPTFTLPESKYKVGTHRSFDINGDAMEPTLFEGDKVLARYVPPDEWETTIKNHYVYVVVTSAMVLIGRVENNLLEDGLLTLRADNTFYDTQAIPRSTIRELWYVRAKTSPFLPSPENIEDYLREEVQLLRRNIRAQTDLIKTLQKTMEELKK